jgi:hypothetical protein
MDGWMDGQKNPRDIASDVSWIQIGLHRVLYHIRDFPVWEWSGDPADGTGKVQEKLCFRWMLL